MKKLFPFLFILSFCSFCFAQSSLKTIQLKDGSVLKGEVLSFQNGTYTVQTNLGQIQVPDNQVVSIQAGDGISSTEGSTSSTPNQLKEQVQKMQGNLMSDPEIMDDMKSLIEDPEIKALLSDPEMINTIMSYDPNQMQQSEKVQRLMANPKIKMLMEKMKHKSTSSGSVLR